ncbi:MAG: glucosaminidase domain-containing protein [Psychrobium sp.]|nr:glucosaminidase domain-containing protein [Psychrobium sp.]
MRFGFVARITLALATLCLLLFLTKTILQQSDQPSESGIASKQTVAETTIKSFKYGMPDFAAISDVKAKKQVFFDYIRPGVQSANRKISLDRQFLLDLKARLIEAPIVIRRNNDSVAIDDQINESSLALLSEQQSKRLHRLLGYYRIKDFTLTTQHLTQLLRRVDIIPNELVMVQAANESGWGTSRFARRGLNFFGQWCFVKGCGLLPSSRNEGASHEVKVFVSVDESIASYLRNLNTHSAYQELREIRAQLRANHQRLTGESIAPGLFNYSQRQQDYINELLLMLRHNKVYL